MRVYASELNNKTATIIDTNKAASNSDNKSFSQQAIIKVRTRTTETTIAATIISTSSCVHTHNTHNS